MGGRPITAREALSLAIFALACLCAIFATWSAFGGTLPLQPKGYRVVAGFPEARTLVANADVRIAGVPVGRVVAVHTGEDTTRAVMQIDPRFAPLHADARALLRTKTPLGESYVQITPGTRTAPWLADGAALPADQVVPTQQVEDVLGTFDPRTRRAFRTGLADTAAMLDGEGAVDLNAALGASGPTVERVGAVVDALDRQAVDVRTLVSRTGVALDAVARRPDQLRDLVRTGRTVFATTAARARDLTATIRGLDHFVAELQATDAPLARTLALAAPTLRRLRPVAPLTAPALRAVLAFSPSARRALDRLPQTLALARRDLPAARRLLPAVDRLGGALDRTGRFAIPIVDLIGTYAGDLVEGATSLGGALQAEKGTGGGSTSRYARSAIHLTSEGNIGFQRREPTNRSNPYPAPGTAFSGLSFDCHNLANAQQTPPAGSYPACHTAPAWRFRGTVRQFPLLTPYMPADKEAP